MKVAELIERKKRGELKDIFAEQRHFINRCCRTDHKAPVKARLVVYNQEIFLTNEGELLIFDQGRPKGQIKYGGQK